MDSYQEFINEAEKNLEAAKQDFDSGNSYGAIFSCGQSIENALTALYIKRFRKEPIKREPVYLVRELKLPQEIVEKSDKVTRIYNPILTSSSPFARNFIQITETILTYVKQNL